ncbi:MAG: class I SAM-dependent methyltransferase [Clostridiales bacterium]|jgi:hypothetical protein|nr:class I SAM-dependent methyltransferase [Clostridiales bacterium]
MEKVLLFGAGLRGRDYLYTKIQSAVGGGGYCVGILDNSPEKQGSEVHGVPVYPPEKARELEFDKAVICVNEQSRRESMFEQLKSLGVPEEKIQYHKQSDADDKRYGLVQRFSRLAREQNISGAAAECGVFRGAFAKEINKAFPDRKLYLFDTFTGFDERDIAREPSVSKCIEAGLSNQTSIETVMGKMKHPENVIIKKGYVPETFAGVDEVFAFVSLDMDLYAPTLAALEFFAPRMSPGGVICMHDWYNEIVFHIKDALYDFERRSGRRLNKIPLCDELSMVLVF